MDSLAQPRVPVRARTRPGRLAALDAWLAHREAALLARGGRVVDLGFGASPATVLELAAAVRGVRADLEVVGLEQEPERVPAAPPPGVELRAGGLAELQALAPALVVRAMNVLRGYPGERVAGFRAALGLPLVEGGLVLEGSTDREGRVTACQLLRRRGPGLLDEGLLLHTDSSRGFSPWLFRDVLPRALRREVRPGSALHARFTAWEAALASAGPGLGPEERLARSLERVAGLEASPWEAARGYLRLRLA